MKKQIRKKKRETLPKLLAKSLCVAIALSAAFGAGYMFFLQNELRRQIERELTDCAVNLQYNLNLLESDPDTKDILQSMSNRMAMLYYYDLMIPDVFTEQNDVQIVPEFSKNCYAAAALIDENSQIAASNREVLSMHVTFQDGTDPDKGIYTCDDEALSMPEVTKLYESFDRLMAAFKSAHEGMDAAKIDDNGWPEIRIESAYVDRETRRMIPHKGSLVVMETNDDIRRNQLVETSEKTVETFEITVNDDAFELITLHQGGNSEYPRSMMTGFYGIESGQFHALTKDWSYPDNNTFPSNGFSAHEQYDEYDHRVPVRIGGKNYCLAVHFYINPYEPSLMRHYWRNVILAALLLCAIAVLWSWRQNVANKAKYAFDDYQRDLTNSLAHDIKTPLTAIGGYAENILDGRLSAEEQQEYLKSILDNVAFTDSLINRTLFLNSMDSAQKPKSEQLKAEQLTESILKKYELMLSERGIGYSVKGSAALTADRAALETVIENLVSNAVKYTPHEGSIKAVLEKKRLTLTNTVDKKIATGNLKRPFVRGDEARSNTEGTGLGLAIAERAAEANGWKLTLSCNDSEFTAELKF